MRSTVFVQPHEVAPGSAIDSSDWNGIADGLASRMELFGGLPEAVWIWFYGGLRNLDATDAAEGVGVLDGLLLEPEDADWPAEATQHNALAGYLMGNDRAMPEALASEATRMLPLTAAQPGDSIQTIWNAGVTQRGLMDPDTGDAAAPAVEAALVHERMWFPTHGVHGLSYGGFAPTFPVASGECTNGDPKPVKREIRFQWIGEGTVADVVYYTCWMDDGGAMGWVNLNDRWKIAVVDSASPEGYYWVDHLKSEWLLTPPDQPGLITHQQGGHLPRAWWAFSQEFAGSTAQRAERTANSWRMAYSYPNKDVLTRPFYLAPARATAAGDPVELTAVPIVFRWSGDDETVPSGTAGVVVATSQTSHSTHASCHWVGLLVLASGLNGPVTLTATVDGFPVRTVTVSPDGAGDFADIAMLPAGQEGAIAWTLAADATFAAGGGEITVDLLEVVKLNPQARDLGAVLLRLASCPAS